MNNKLYRILESGQLACEYQPIVSIDSLETVAFEALARFRVDGSLLPNDEVFEAMHHDPVAFFLLESRLKAHQLMHRPPGVPLYVNLDPDVCDQGYSREHWLGLFARADQVTVELIENTHTTHLEKTRDLVAALQGAKIRVALDDVGGERSLLAIDLLERADAIKLDRVWLQRARRSEAHRALLLGLVQFGRMQGRPTVLEGVETQADLELARAIGVSHVQGFLFRDRFLQAGPQG
jgi:EAL domain-containing protein (putative c-di-GMP-specific phosphodiesterase class I)